MKWIAPILFVLIFRTSSYPATITVDLNGSGDYTNIQSAIDTAQDGDTVLVKPGEYVIKESVTYRGKAISMIGEKGPGETTIRMSETPSDPSRASVVIFAEGETENSVLQGFTLTGGNGTRYQMHHEEVVGGGILCLLRSSPTLIHCTIIKNSHGGVFGEELSSPALTNCTISENSGSGLEFMGECLPILTNCTISGNSGSGLDCRWGSTATLISSIVWDNGGESIGHDEESSIEVRYSCIEIDELWSGIGNINDDPLFCGWIDAEVWVENSYSGPGDGSKDKPFSDLRAALENYGLSLASNSPCLGTGEGGSNMGADTGVCIQVGESARLIHLGSGTFRINQLSLTCRVSIQGSGREETVIEGTVHGLRTGAVLSDLTVTAGTEGGIVVRSGQAPKILNCKISGNSTEEDGGGIYCSNSSPLLSDCAIIGNSAKWDDGGGERLLAYPDGLHDLGELSPRRGRWWAVLP